MSVSFVLCQKVKVSVALGCNSSKQYHKQYQNEVITKRGKKKKSSKPCWTFYATYASVRVQDALFKMKHLKLQSF